MTIKMCKKCDVKPKALPYSYCKSCQAQYSKVYRAINSDTLKANRKSSTPHQRWERHLRSRYNLTTDQYTEMSDSQNNVCKICKNPSERSRLSVDHCHETGIIRGLLCERCNTLLGRVKDSPDILLNAAKYLIQSLVPLSK